LGCGLEKRPPYPRLTEFGGDAPRLAAGRFTLLFIHLIINPLEHFFGDELFLDLHLRIT
jgi:hypothetical protein